jgi:hypothetical protein
MAAQVALRRQQSQEEKEAVYLFKKKIIFFKFKFIARTWFTSWC